MKDIMTKNSKGGLHGYQEYYYKNGLLSRFNCKNSVVVNYTESHGSKITRYYII